MSAFTAAACRLLNYRCPIASLGIVRKARYIIPSNGFPCKISTTCNHFSNDDKSGVDPKQGVNKTPDVKAQIFTHDNAVFHDQICKSLFGDGAKNLFRMMSESKIRFQVVTGKDNIEVIATSDERLEQAKQIVEKEVEDIKSKLQMKPSANTSAYEEKVLLDWDPAVPKKQVKGRFIGVRGNNVRQLMNQFDSKVSIHWREDHVLIKGKDKELVKAATVQVKEQLKETVGELESSRLVEVVPTPAVQKHSFFTAKVDVPKENVNTIVGYIIGAKGRNIRHLGDQAGFGLTVSSGPDYVEVKVNDEANLEKAVQLVTKEIEAFKEKTFVVPTPAVQKHSFFTAKVDVPKENVKAIVGYIIGAKGRNIRHLGDQAGFSLTVSSGPDYVEVNVHDEANLEKAVQLVTKEIEAFKEKSFVVPTPVVQKHSFFTAKVDVQKENVKAIVGYIIGAQGRNIRHLEDQAGFSLTVSSGPDYVEVKVNDEANLEKAVQLVTKEIEDFEQKQIVVPTPAVQKHSFFTAKVDVQKENVNTIVGFIIGAKGRNIQHLEDQAGFSLTVSSGPDYVEVKVNDEANLEKAVQLVEKEIERIISSKSTVERRDTDGDPSRARTIQVDEGMDIIFRRLIGKGGSHVNYLRQQIGVDFSINKMDMSTIVVGVNNPGDLDVAVEEVTKEIEALKQNLSADNKDTAGDPCLSRVIPIDGSLDTLFGRLIGKKGDNVKRLREQIGVNFGINKTDSSDIVIVANNPGDLDVAVEGVTKEIEALKQNLSADNKDTAGDPSLSRVIPIDGSMDSIFSRLIGKKGDNVKRLREQIGVNFNINKMDTSTIVVGVNNPADLDLAVEGVKRDIEAIKQTRLGTARYPQTSIDWDTVLYGEMDRLGIFEKSDLHKESPRIECPLWDKLQAEEESERRRAFHVNNFDRMISLTEEGKLWKFPINNDQGWTEEEDVSFGEHVFLDPLIEDFPKKGPVRHFMELVTAGLSKNPHMTVKEKHDHINWYRTYFIENQDLMREELGEEHGTIREPHQPV